MSRIATTRRIAVAAVLALGVLGAGGTSPAQASSCANADREVTPTYRDSKGTWGATTYDFEGAVRCLVGEFRAQGGVRTPLSSNHALNITAGENTRAQVSTGRANPEPTQDRASRNGYRMGWRCFDQHTHIGWVRDASTHVVRAWGGSPTPRVAVYDLMHNTQLGAYVRQAKFIDIGVSVKDSTYYGSGATFSVVIGQCNQG